MAAADPRHARGTWIAWSCIAFGLLIVLYAGLRFVAGGGGVLALVVGAPALAYGVFMLRAVRRVRR